MGMQSDGTGGVVDDSLSYEEQLAHNKLVERREFRRSVRHDFYKVAAIYIVPVAWVFALHVVASAHTEVESSPVESSSPAVEVSALKLP